MAYGAPIKKLFTPIKINQLEIRNRIVLPAMHLGYTPGGLGVGPPGRVLSGAGQGRGLG